MSDNTQPAVDADVERLLTPAHEIPDDQLQARFYELKRYYVARGKYQDDAALDAAANAAAKASWEALDQRLCELQIAIIMRWRRVVVAPTKKGSRKAAKQAKPLDLASYLDSLTKAS